MRLLMLVLIPTLLLGCKDADESVRFATYPSKNPANTTVIEFNDGAEVDVECFIVETNGEMKSQWKESASPIKGNVASGLGNTVFITAEPKLTFELRSGNYNLRFNSKKVG